MFRRVLASALLLAVAAAPSVSVGEDDDRGLKAAGVTPYLQARIDHGIELAIGSLRASQREDGGWRLLGPAESSPNLGLTALAGLALRHGGVSSRDPAVRRAAALLFGTMRDREKRRPQRPTLLNTYTAGLTIAFLLECGHDPKDPLLIDLVNRLADSYCEDGQWGYVPFRYTKTADGRQVGRYAFGNISTTLYAVYGLRAARRHGMLFPEEGLDKLRRRLRRDRRDGGWNYDPGNPNSTQEVYFSGTASGLAEYVMAGEILGLYPDPAAAREDPVVMGAIDWLGAHFDPRAGYHVALGGGTRRRVVTAWSTDPNYNYYAVERAGVLLGLRTFGKVDWYVRGAEDLLSRQHEDGSWQISRALYLQGGSMWDQSVVTAFGLLFLARGTRPVGEATPLPEAASSSGGDFDDLDLSRGPSLNAADFADLFAAAFAALGDLPAKEAATRIPALAALGPRVVGATVAELGADSGDRRGLAIRILEALVGERFGYDPDGPEESRARAVGIWRGWLERAGPHLVREGDRFAIRARAAGK